MSRSEQELEIGLVYNSYYGPQGEKILVLAALANLQDPQNLAGFGRPLGLWHVL